MATLHELDTIYGVEDLYDMLEILHVDALNKSIAERAARRMREI